MDVVDKATRSRMMSGIRGTNTHPEILVRRALFGEGLRYRLHVNTLPGKPDIVLAKHRAVVLVHGCFWHGHGCALFKWPATRQVFWKRKIHRNQERDRDVCAELVARGWRVLEIWECALKGPQRRDPSKVGSAAARWVRGHRKHGTIEGQHRRGCR